MKKAIASLGFLILASALAPIPSLADPLAANAFAYDASAPLAMQVKSQHTTSGVKVSDVTFASAGGRRIHGEIAAPVKTGARRPGILFVHWLGEPATTNLTEFRSDAMRLAKDGFVTLSIDAMWAKPDWFETGRSLETDYRDSIDQVVDIRRALDALLAQPGIDRSRIAYVGHDFGAMYGAVVSGVDPRPQYYVLMAGTATFSEWYLLGKHPADTAAYQKQMAPLDPTQYLRESNAKAYLFQFANKDRYIKSDRALALFDAAPAPKGMMVYVADHSLQVPAAHADRITWLEARLRQTPEQ